MSEFPVLPFTLNTSDNNLTEEFYTPCLKWATKYDRGVGYFTSGWISRNATGMSEFAASGGTVRWITSPILDSNDFESIRSGLNDPENLELFKVLKEDVELLKIYLEDHTQNVIAWLIYDGLLEFKFAVPKNDLDGGDFHDKFGIFKDDEDNFISFNGSINDSKKGYSNYESIKVFSSWIEGLDHFVKEDINKFETLWNDHDPNVKVYNTPEGIKEEIFKLRKSERPYNLQSTKSKLNKWRHQSEAIDKFLLKGNGILEMATGTGKTRTALRIVNELFERDEIKYVIITVKGTDLLDQWCKEVSKWTNLTMYKQFSSFKEISGFKLSTGKSVLVISRDNLKKEITKIPSSYISNTIIIADEVHGLGSQSMVEGLKGRLKPFKYRLGLSATPEREYDEEGNQFIEEEIGVPIFQFKLADAIRRGILCEFDYHPIEYSLSDEDNRKIKQIISNFKAKEKEGIFVSQETLYRDLARVKKTSENKLPLFSEFLKEHPNIVDRSIIFVETKEFGEKVQEILMRYQPYYHTYYGEDDRRNLVQFSNGELNCLITSKRISEGIDIKSVNNIILFSADKAKIQTIQRIGRSLRIDPDNDNKRAAVVDFIQEQNDDKERNSDQERKDWLQILSNIKRVE
ncbi:DEAD/DEAH box helicase family protein [Pontibacillus salipaludis]|uniref:DNA-repair protein n=1 Tax=Pontibacillus salipaludis TaxID=1697394 RepID=A0ABQ1PIG9_9BACI|nr:DEAD/DEAH box helicase family protein [Pontibacillus salipaludis]GGC97891.1 DNA-repair protein [Pontibacillus salipaludis]